MQVSTSYISTSLSVAAETTRAATASTAPAPAQTDRVELSVAALQAQSASLAASGTAAGKKGEDVAFTLGLDYQHASVATMSAAVVTGPSGSALTTAQSAVDVTATSFEFAMSSEGTAPSHLNDEVSNVGKEIKPAVKEFLAAAGMKGGWGQVNRMLRSVA